MPFLIAIDGPAGAGKSTAARRVASALGFTYLDTGAMYRSVAWKAQQTGASADDAPALEALTRTMRIEFAPLEVDGTQRVRVDGQDVTMAIRTPEVSSLTSRIAVVPGVRRIVVEQQRAIGDSASNGVVLEGRDIGSVVFPRAQLKIFLTASPEERARRRVEELAAQGMQADLGQTLADIRERDSRDSHRTESPLVRADDAVAVNTDGVTLDQVVAEILRLCEERRPQPFGPV